MPDIEKPACIRGETVEELTDTGFRQAEYLDFVLQAAAKASRDYLEALANPDEPDTPDPGDVLVWSDNVYLDEGAYQRDMLSFAGFDMKIDTGNRPSDHPQNQAHNFGAFQIFEKDGNHMYVNVRRLNGGKTVIVTALRTPGPGNVIDWDAEPAHKVTKKIPDFPERLNIRCRKVGDVYSFEYGGNLAGPDQTVFKHFATLPTDKMPVGGRIIVGSEDTDGESSWPTNATAEIKVYG